MAASGTFTHLTKDALLQVDHTMPAAAANSDSDYLDIGEGMQHRKAILIELPATDSLVEDKTIIFTVKSCATTDGTYVSTGQTFTVTGAATNISAAAEFLYRPTPDVDRYIKINAAVLTGGGDVTDTDATYSVVAE